MIAIDLGSNTLRVLEYDCVTHKATYTFEKVVKTADGLAEFGLINSNAVCRVINAIQEVQMKIDFEGQELRAVTTEALRRASNTEDVLNEIEEVTGIRFEVISAEKEALLTLSAVKQRLDKLQYASDSFVLVDIGGGSTEIIFQYKEEVITKSFPIGIVTMAQKYQTLENIQKALNTEMFAVQMFCAEMNMTKGKPNSFVATAGTPTTVAAMKLGFNYETYDANKINGTSLEKFELDFYLKKLLAMSSDERELAVGTGRSDLIASGILIYKQLYTILELETCVVVDDGLREGVALEMCQ
jgi:exopolyphosphatase/guanosine-5'-triphosphate,3'-diphosphate pyrophosphatase